MPGKTLYIPLAAAAGVAGAAAAFKFFRSGNGHDDDEMLNGSSDGGGWSSRNLYAPDSPTSHATGSSFNEQNDNPYAAEGTASAANQATAKSK